MTSILEPIGPQSIAQAEKCLTRMLGKFHQAWDPATLPPMALIFDVKKPLQRVWFGDFRRDGKQRRRVQRFIGIKPAGKFSMVWTGAGSIVRLMRDGQRRAFP